MRVTKILTSLGGTMVVIGLAIVASSVPASAGEDASFGQHQLIHDNSSARELHAGDWEFIHWYESEETCQSNGKSLLDNGLAVEYRCDYHKPEWHLYAKRNA